MSKRSADSAGSLRVDANSGDPLTHQPNPHHPMTTPATPSAPTNATRVLPDSVVEAIDHLVGQAQRYPRSGAVITARARLDTALLAEFRASQAEIDRLRSSPGATPTEGETMTDAHDAIFEGVREDAALGAALREALATVPDFSRDLLIDPYHGGVYVKHGKMLNENDATRALATQLRAVTTGETT